MHFIASGLIDNLRTETDGSISTISAKSSFVFWVFFVVLQVAFAAGLFFWKGLVNEKKKHF